MDEEGQGDDGGGGPEPSPSRSGFARLLAGAQNALELVRVGHLTEPEPAPYAVAHRERTYRLRHYAGSGATADVGPLLLVPPLMVASEIYDVSPEVSAVRWLEDAGVDLWLCDFGAPEHEEGGLERTLDDHVRAVSAAVDEVRRRTGRDVHLAGYSQGGMFVYQAAAFRRSEGLASLITFGSPVDLNRNLPAVAEGAAEQIYRALHAALDRPLSEVDGIPGFLSSLGFKLISLRKEATQMAELVAKLHDRRALERREQRRRFLGGEGFVAWPGPALRKFIDEFVIHNRMISGGFVIDGRTVTLADIDTPILYFVGERDELARVPAVRAVRQAVPRSEIHEVLLPAGHFGLVVGSTSLAHTWPTVVEWMRWRDGGGERPRLLRPGTSALPPAPATAPGVVVAASEEAGLDLALLGDVAKGAVASVGRKAGRWAEDAGGLLRSLRYQVPRIGQLERMEASSRVGLSQALRARAETAPDDLFFLWRGRAFSYGDADRRVDHVVRGLHATGVRPGARVGVLMSARPSTLTTVAALNRLGAVAVMLRPQGSDEELMRCLEAAGAGTVIAEPEAAARALRVCAGTVRVLGGGGEPRDLGIPGVIDLEAIDPAGVTLPEELALDAGEARDLALVLFTAPRHGETTPRMARITNGRWAFSALGAAATCTLTSDDTVYAALPLHHAAGILVAVGSAIVSGARLALAEAPLARRLDADVASFWSEVRRYGATVVFYAGEMCRPLILAAHDPADSVVPLRLVAGSGMRPAVWTALRERFGVGVLEFYASTESSAVLANASGRKVGGVGRPLPGSVAMALVPVDLGSGTFPRDADGHMWRARTGEPGVLLLRDDERHPGHGGGPARDDVLRDVFTQGDRWFASADVLVRDGEGDHRFLGRLDQAALGSDGVPVWPRELEEALETDGRVALALAFAREDGPAAVVALARHARVDGEVLAAALAPLRPEAWPTHVVVVRLGEVELTDGYRPRRGLLARRLEADIAARRSWVRCADGYARALDVDARASSN
ncbi:MAG: AMP-binding protein [Myxococcota bacterium]